MPVLWACRLAVPAAAHPLDEIGVCHDTILVVSRSRIEIRYLLWFAEIAAYPERKKIDVDDDGVWTPDERDAYIWELAPGILSGLSLAVDDKPARVRFDRGVIPADSVDRMSLSVKLIFTAAVPAMPPGRHSLRFRDRTYAREYGAVSVRAKWEEGLVAVTPAAKSPGEAPPPDPAAAVAVEGAYAPPPQQRELAVTFRVPGPPPAAKTAALGGARPSERAEPTEAPRPFERKSAARSREAKKRMQGLIASSRRGAGYWLFALGVAALLGAFHALEPGHGKALVAAYLVGARGTVRHALILGLVVTITHTAGVILLGLVLLYLQEHVAPAAIGPAVTVFSGALIALIGAFLLVRRALGIEGHGHSHGADHSHSHSHSHGADHSHSHGADHSHSHGHTHGHTHALPDSLSLRTLIALGVSGGIVPCPPALVALIFAFSIGRVGFGLAIILAFSFGLALVLCLVGVATVTLRGVIGRSDRTGPFLRMLPVFSALVVLALGLAIVVQGLIEAGIVTIHL